MSRVIKIDSGLQGVNSSIRFHCAGVAMLCGDKLILIKTLRRALSHHQTSIRYAPTRKLNKDEEHQAAQSAVELNTCIFLTARSLSLSRSLFAAAEQSLSWQSFNKILIEGFVQVAERERKFI
jgi:hypothetical protein